MCKSGICVVLVLVALIVYSCNEGYRDSDTLDFNIEEYLHDVDDGSEFIIIPDIQNYISYQTNVKYLETIINWPIKFDNSRLKVKAVLQVGDVTNFNNKKEWERAQKIFSKLCSHVDYIPCAGNHDNAEGGDCKNRRMFFSEYFNFKNNSSFVDFFEKNKFENSFFHCDIQGQPFHLISLEF